LDLVYTDEDGLDILFLAILGFVFEDLREEAV
jgi:hypothetical protein